jgi:hypothetical protein
MFNQTALGGISMKIKRLLLPLRGLAAIAAVPLQTFAAADKPNILVIWGDDVGYWTVSA